jgi:sirohydrochlorin cobaltochelatase
MPRTSFDIPTGHPLTRDDRKRFLADRAADLAGALAELRSAPRVPRPVSPRTAALLVTFGTSVPEARVAFDHLGQVFTRSFPGLPLYWAVTSPIIRTKLALAGLEADSPSRAMARLLDDGFDRVAVQSLHTIPGVEYRQLAVQIRAFARIPAGFERVVLGRPLLFDDDDLDEAARATLASLPPGRTPDEAVVLMGHGTWHAGKAFYAAVHARVQALDPNVFIGAMEGSLAAEAIRSTLLARGVRKAYLAPFMSVAGEHAVNDMAGEGLDSWRAVLSDSGGTGLEIVPVLKGTAEFKDFAHIWAGHLRLALDELEA